MKFIYKEIPNFVPASPEKGEKLPSKPTPEKKDKGVDPEKKDSAHWQGQIDTLVAKARNGNETRKAEFPPKEDLEAQGFSPEIVAGMIDDVDRMQESDKAKEMQLAGIEKIPASEILKASVAIPEENTEPTEEEIRKALSEGAEKLAQLFLSGGPEDFLVNFHGNQGAIRQIGLGDMFPPNIQYLKVNGVLGKRSISENGKVGYLDKNGKYLPVFGEERISLVVSEEEKETLNNIQTRSLKEELEAKRSFMQTAKVIEDFKGGVDFAVNSFESFGDGEVDRVAGKLSVDPQLIRAILKIESNGNTGAIRFEPHVFHRYLRKGHSPEEARLLATSFGAFQIMGFNYRTAGYDSVESFVKGMQGGPAKQLEAFAGFITSNPSLLSAMQNNNFERIAYYYNGPLHARNNYVGKLMRYTNTYGGYGRV